MAFICGMLRWLLLSWEQKKILHSHAKIKVGWFISGRGTTRAEDAQGTPTQSHTSPSILVYADKSITDPGVFRNRNSHGSRTSPSLTSLTRMVNFDRYGACDCHEFDTYGACNCHGFDRYGECVCHAGKLATCLYTLLLCFVFITPQPCVE